jgi:quinol monooxygenase YgiN
MYTQDEKKSLIQAPGKENPMIILNVTYKCNPGMREEFLKAIITEGIDAACRAEAGNIKYDYYRSVDDSDELLLVEKWQDAQALAAHGKQPHFARLGEIKVKFVTDTVIEKYFV